MRGRLVRSVRNASLLLAMQFAPACAQGVTIDLEGQIPVSCGFESLTSQISLGDISRAASKVVPLRVRCNTPFTFEIVSQNGALQTTAPGPVSWGFTDRVHYTVALLIPTDIGVMTGACRSWRLRRPLPTCAYPDSGEGIALSGEGSLTIVWGSRREPLAGTYSDVMTVVLGARL